MKIAIIGAGFAGLGVAYHLSHLSTHHIDLFEGKGVGFGASGAATGLMHPYVGSEVKRSEKATEGLAATHHLLDVAEGELGIKVADHSGILRYAESERQKKKLDAATIYDDVEKSGDGYLIKSGVTVYAPLYLEGLFAASRRNGVHFVHEEVKSLDQLKEYDRVIIAAGGGIEKFPFAKELNLKFTKGQMLICHWPKNLPPLRRSLLGKGYLVMGSDNHHCLLGSTYERNYETLDPDIDVAKKEIFAKVRPFFPRVETLPVQHCLSDVRVSPQKGHYPIVKKIDPKTWVVTGFGSRGLLYHAYIGELLARTLVT